MGFLSRLLGLESRESSPDHHNSESSHEKHMKVLSAISVGIVDASWKCTEEINPSLKGFKKKVELPDLMVFYEFLCFYTHLLMRAASHLLTENQIQALQDYIGPMVASAAIEPF